MYRRIFAFDFDGTLTTTDAVGPRVLDALRRLQRAGCALFLVTGRRLGTVALGAAADTFVGIVWENGAVIEDRTRHDVYLPFGRLDPRVSAELVVRQVPFARGAAIVATWTAHEAEVYEAVGSSGTEATVAHNKSALMLLPPGANKASGLERLLDVTGYSPRNLVAFGDAENDVPLLEIAETGVAVADAVPGLRGIADLIADLPGPDGVLQILDRYWLSEPPRRAPASRKQLIRIGEDATGTEVFLSGATLAGGVLGVFGESGSGKSWVTGLIAEGMLAGGYQILLIDPEGDYRGLRSLARVVAVSGNETTMPVPSVVATLLEAADVSVVVDLAAYPFADRRAYVVELLRAVAPLRERKFRPHWLVLEEAQHFVAPNDRDIALGLEPFFAGGGAALVSYRPDRLAPAVRDRVTQLMLTRMTDPDTIAAAVAMVPSVSPAALATMPRGRMWLADETLVELNAAVPRIAHVRHRYKYLDVPLPRNKRFYFRTEHGYLGIEAANLFELKQLLPELPIECLTYHDRRGDFATWARGSLGDNTLAAHFAKLARRRLDGEELRDALLGRVRDYYAEIYAS